MQLNCRREIRFFQSAAQAFAIEMVSTDSETCVEFLRDAIYIGRMTRRWAGECNQTHQ